MANDQGPGPADNIGGDTIAPGATVVDTPPETLPAQEAAPGPQGDVLLGRTIAGRYEITHRIGAGGMGVVYKAYQAAMGRHIALKVLSASLASDETSVRRFNQEARAASRLRHPNTITLHDFGKTDDDVLFIAMEFLDGTSLEDTMREAKRMPLGRAIKVLAQVCRSLAEAHDAGIIHRDLKPDNIFLCTLGGEKDFVKVLDFGVAKLREAKRDGGTLTQAGMIFGTPRYMSPEQAQSLELDARSDLYALGVMLYEMLAGRPPFVADSPLSILIQHVHEQPPPFTEEIRETVPESLERLIFELLDKDPARRPGSATAMLERLLDIAHELRPGTGERPTGTGLSGLTDLRAFDSDPGGMRQLPADEQPDPGAPPRAPGRADVRADTPAQPDTAPDASPAPLGDPGGKGDTWANKNTPSEQWAFAVEDRPGAGGRSAGVPVPVVVGIVGLAAVAIGAFVAIGGNSNEKARPAAAITTEASVAAPTPAAAPIDTAAPAAAVVGDGDAKAEADKPTDKPTDEPAAPAAPAAPAPAPKPKAAKVVKKRPPRPPPKPKVEKVTITIATIPAGAAVKSGGSFLGLSPVTLERPKSTTAVKFQLTKKGYKPTSALAVMSKTNRVTTRLQKE